MVVNERGSPLRFVTSTVRSPSSAQSLNSVTSVGNDAVSTAVHTPATSRRARKSRRTPSMTAVPEASAPPSGSAQTWNSAVCSLGAGTTSAPHVRPSALARASGVDVPVPSARRTCADPMATNPAGTATASSMVSPPGPNVSSPRSSHPAPAPRTHNPLPPAGPPISVSSAGSSTEPKAMSVPFPLRTKPAAAGTTSGPAGVHDTPSGEAVHSSSDDHVYDPTCSVTIG